MSFEIRAVKGSARAAGDNDNGKTASGLGIVYEQWTELWPGFHERILKGAAKPSGIVKSYIDHDSARVLSTTESDPPLTLVETDSGYEYHTPIPPTSYGRDLEINLERGNIKGASFAFNVPRDGDRWWEENGITYREISKLEFWEIGPVADPAYLQTTSGVRTAQQALDEYRSRCNQEIKPLPGISTTTRQRQLKQLIAESQ